MEIQPASIAQVRRGKNGRMVCVEDDVLDIARRLQAIDSRLRLSWSEEGEYFCVSEICADNKERIVLTTNELDERVVKRVAQIIHRDYDYLAEVDRMDKQAEKEEAHRFSEQTGEVGERLAHALRKDLQYKRLVVPRDVNGDSP